MAIPLLTLNNGVEIPAIGFGVFQAAPADPGVREAVDSAYHAKYDRYGPGPVGAVTGPDAPETTLRVTPRDST
jgi:hypothetical protein